jgi:hypothetical protein
LQHKQGKQDAGATMEKVPTPAGTYTVYRGSEAPPKREAYDPEKWYFEPEAYIGYTIFSEGFDTLEEARRTAIETGEREERLKNEIGGGG